MPSTHRGMNINAEEYMAAVDDILATLDKHRIDEQTRKDVLAIAYSLKGDNPSRLRPELPPESGVAALFQGAGAAQCGAYTHAKTGRGVCPTVV